jgi:hypothetical protein
MRKEAVIKKSETFPRNLREGADKFHDKKPRQGNKVSWLRLEPNTSKLPVRSARAWISFIDLLKVAKLFQCFDIRSSPQDLNIDIKNTVSSAWSHYRYQEHSVLYEISVSISRTRCPLRDLHINIKNTVPSTRSQYRYQEHSVLYESSISISRTQCPLRELSINTKNVAFSTRAQYRYQGYRVSTGAQYRYHEHSVLYESSVPI